MLARAAHREIYSAVVEDDILHFLQACQQRFDLIIAADVCVYLGDLDLLFKECRRLLKPNGLMALTVEALPDAVLPYQNYHLQRSGRFAHHKIYLLDLAKRYGYQLHLEEMTPRLQDGEPVPGYLLVLGTS
jgi:predicted TPR repeat methyltransferase